MKHSMPVTLFLVAIFFFSQLIGLGIISQYIDVEQTSATGKTVVREETYDLTGVEPPQVENESYTWIFIVAAILIGTGFVLLIIRFKKMGLWKVWFFLAMFVCLRYALAPFIAKFAALFSSSLVAYSVYATIVIALVLAFYKVYRFNVYIHNITELLVYGGLAALVVPILNLTSAFLLLVAISIYDMIAVWKSKHMVTMAQAQTDAKVFAGLMIPYKKLASGKHRPVHMTDTKKQGKAKISESKATQKSQDTEAKKTQGKDIGARTAILGGGDIAFPMLFTGAVLKSTGTYIAPFVVITTTALALFMLFFFAKKDRFYPAMPFISAGCFAGFLLTLLF